MTLVAPAAQFDTPDDVSDILVADFAARGIDAVVEVGEWGPEPDRGTPRVIVGYGKGRVGQPAGHYQPGPMIAPPGTTGQVSSTMLDDAQRFTFLVHAPAHGSGEGVAVAARRATKLLQKYTLAALSRALGGPFREPADVSWPTNSDARFAEYQGYVYGSICEFELVLASPILDDPFNVIRVTEAASTIEVDFADGSTTPPEAA